MPTRDNAKPARTALTAKKQRATRSTEQKLGNSVDNAPLEPRKANWTFLTNHAHVIILLAKNPNLVLREVAVQIGITERAVQRIIADLEEEGFIIREKIGRQNQYRVATDLPLRHPIESHRRIGDLVALIITSK